MAKFRPSGAMTTSNPAGADFVFGVDLDGVVADFIAGLRPIAAEWLDVPLDTLSERTSRMGFEEWGVDDAAYPAVHAFGVRERNLFDSLPPMRGAVDALRRLSDEGIRIRIITHRLYVSSTHEQAVTQTVRWLDRHGVPYWDLCFMRQKAAVEADAYVEDNPENIGFLRKEGNHAIHFDPWHLSPQVAAPRADTWDEVESWVLELASGSPAREQDVVTAETV